MEILFKIIFTSLISLPVSCLGFMFAEEAMEPGMAQDFIHTLSALIMVVSILVVLSCPLAAIWLS